MCCAVLPNGELLVSGGVPADRRVLKATITGKHCTMCTCVLYVTVLPSVNVHNAKDSGKSLLLKFKFWVSGQKLVSVPDPSSQFNSDSSRRGMVW